MRKIAKFSLLMLGISLIIATPRISTASDYLSFSIGGPGYRFSYHGRGPYYGPRPYGDYRTYLRNRGRYGGYYGNPPYYAYPPFSGYGGYRGYRGTRGYRWHRRFNTHPGQAGFGARHGQGHRPGSHRLF